MERKTSGMQDADRPNTGDNRVCGDQTIVDAASSIAPSLETSHEVLSLLTAIEWAHLGGH